MTDLYFLVTRDEDRVAVKIDQMTDDEIDALAARTTDSSKLAWGLVKAMAQWMRDHKTNATRLPVLSDPDTRKGTPL